MKTMINLNEQEKGKPAKGKPAASEEDKKPAEGKPAASKGKPAGKDSAPSKGKDSAKKGEKKGVKGKKEEYMNRLQGDNFCWSESRNCTEKVWRKYSDGSHI